MKPKSSASDSDSKSTGQKLYAPVTETIEDVNSIKKPSKQVKCNSPAKTVSKTVAKELEYRGYQKHRVDSESYNPKADAPYSIGQSAPFFLIADTFDILAETKGKDCVEKKKMILANLFLTLLHNSPHEVDELFFFATRRIESDYIQGDLGIGKSTTQKAGRGCISKKEKEMREGVRELGDLGSYVESKKSGQRSLASMFGTENKKLRLTVTLT